MEITPVLLLFKPSPELSAKESRIEKHPIRLASWGEEMARSSAAALGAIDVPCSLDGQGERHRSE